MIAQRSPGLRQPYTPEEYLSIEEASDNVKHEFCDGQIFAMTGAQFTHCQVTTSFSAQLLARLQGRCAVLSSDMRVGTPSRGGDGGGYFYPDVAVACSPKIDKSRNPPTLLNPCLLVEVLSQSTGSFDRGAKFEHYQRLDSLRDFIMAAADKPLVEHHTRAPDSSWTKTTLHAGQTIELRALNIAIPVNDVYSVLNIKVE